MADVIDPELVAYLSRSSGLAAALCRRLTLEVLAEYNETLEEFVTRRHGELKAVQGLKNERIYRRIREELASRRFAAPELSERQIRRMIYG